MLFSKVMSNIYLKDAIEKNFNFLSLKSSSAGQFLEKSNKPRYH